MNPMAPSHLPTTSSPSRTGAVKSSSMVPLPVSSAIRRMVRKGTVRSSKVTIGPLPTPPNRQGGRRSKGGPRVGRRSRRYASSVVLFAGGILGQLQEDRLQAHAGRPQFEQIEALLDDGPRQARPPLPARGRV